jgi:hypothetical protein
MTDNKRLFPSSGRYFLQGTDVGFAAAVMSDGLERVGIALPALVGAISCKEFSQVCMIQIHMQGAIHENHSKSDEFMFGSEPALG